MGIKINTIKDGKQNILTDTSSIQRIIRNWYTHVYPHKSEILDRFLDSQHHMHTYEATENLNKPIMETEIKSVVKASLQ